MDNRLKQIWSGFKTTTTRHLADAGVENIVVPHRVDYAAEDQTFLPEEFDAPAEAAFKALRDKLEHQEKKFSFKKRRQSAGQSNDTKPPSPMSTQSFDGEELVRGLKATALRTERPDRDYETFLSSDAGKEVLKKHKKKRFGIF